MGPVGCIPAAVDDVGDPCRRLIADGARRSRARISRRSRPTSTTASSIPPSAAGVSAMPAPGAAIGRAMARPISAAPFNRWPPLGEVCGATAFMAWCQNTLAWYVTNSGNAALKARFAEPRRGRAARRHRPFQPDEDLLRHREIQAEGPQGRRRLRRARRAALGVQSRPRPFLRHHLRDRGRARRDRDVPGRLRRPASR